MYRMIVYVTQPVSSRCVSLSYHGNIEFQHLIDPRRMVLLKERYAEQ